MLFAERRLTDVVRAALDRRQWLGVLRGLTTYAQPMRELIRYAFGTGQYPRECVVRTPFGRRTVNLWTRDDLRTLHIIFCRRDYPMPPHDGVVVDFGSNIGISALYFLTQAPLAQAFLFEPVPRNVKRLRQNLGGLEDRYTITEAAIYTESGRVSLGVEDTGIYGGILSHSNQRIEVDAVEVNTAIQNVLGICGRIDLLKVDVEGLEEELVLAVRPEIVNFVDVIALETSGERRLHPDSFDSSFHPGIQILLRRR